MNVTSIRAAAVAIFIAVGHSSASPQGLWREASTLGYGGIGFGSAVAACRSCSYETAAGVILGGTALGMIVGNLIGGAAERTAEAGVRPSEAQLLGARIGTVTGFATIGAAVGGLYANVTDSGREGEDERQILITSLMGAVVGVFVEVRQERGLPAAGVSNTASLSVGPAPLGGVSIGILLPGR